MDNLYLKEYTVVPYNPRKGYPGGIGLRYRCIICGDIIPSMPSVGMACGCGNLLVDQRGVQVKHDAKQPMLIKKKSFLSKLFKKG